MPTISIDYDFDLTDYIDEIEDDFCYGNCLRNKDFDCNELRCNLEQYCDDLYKNLYIYPRSSKKSKTMEEIYNDLINILKGN